MEENRRNIDTTQSTVSNMFRENKPAQVAGYVGVEGQAKGAPGDDDAPWVKEPAFVTDAIVLVDELSVPLSSAMGAAYVPLPSIECRQHRLLQFYFSYVMAVSGQLSIIPEANVNGVWYVETLVGGTVTPLVPIAPFTAGGFGSRPLQRTELRTDVFAAGTANFTLTFDVASLDMFRLNVIDIGAQAGNTLRLLYALSN